VNRTPLVTLLAIAALGCGGGAAAPTQTPPPATTPPPPAAEEAAPVASGPTKTWKELYADVPPTEVAAAKSDPAAFERYKKLSIDIEVTYEQLAKLTQTAPLSCPMAKATCDDTWTRYARELGALKRRIDKRATACPSDDERERDLVSTHADYQGRKYQEHVQAILDGTDGAEAKTALKRKLDKAEREGAAPPPNCGGETKPEENPADKPAAKPGDKPAKK
jgi:hypothetical protein